MSSSIVITSRLATATKKWTQVLALLADAPVDDLVRAVMHACARGTADPAAIALLLRQHRAPAPKPTLELHRLPESARIETTNPDLNAYATALLIEGAA